MIFLVPLLIIIAVIFGIDYLYFSDDDEALKEKKEKKIEKNLSLEEKKNELKSLLYKDEN